jgi:glycosyltransferase involved in cell wall biosynthesis
VSVTIDARSPLSEAERAVGISIITPTVGRSSLARTAQSVIRQLGDSDQWIVVSDGPSDAAKSIVEAFSDSRVIYRESTGTQRWGNHERDIGIEKASGARLVFVDDDDELTDDAIAIVKRAHVQNPSRPLMCRMHVLPNERILWERTAVASGNVGTPMFCPLLDRSRMPKWSDASVHNYGSDYVFIRTCCQRQGEPVFVRNVICRVHHALVPPNR